MEPGELLSHPAVRHARVAIHARDARTLRDQIELVQIPAPSLQEAERARELLARFEAAGLTDARIDEVGNVLGRLPTSGSGSEANGAEGAVVVCAHLDTVFPAATDLSVSRSHGRVLAPGITDNVRGLAAMLALIEVLVESGISTSLPLVFAATVGEEGIGDLRGVKHLFREGAPLRTASACVALDGSGVRRIVNRAVGSRRLRIHICGPGGHSWSDWGTANAIHALAGAVAEMRALPLPASPRTTLSVTRVGGGTSVNTIPAGAWLELDLRSESQEALEQLDAAARRISQSAAAAENRQRRRGTGVLTVQVECIGDRPPGKTPAPTPLVQAALAATRAVGERPVLVASSTDANVPISLGIPAVTLGAGGESGGIHTTEEWYSNERGPEGIERALLTLLAVAGIL
ncbi:M20/M25/M40 family metallo-hydrolase [soil metagenome]